MLLMEISNVFGIRCLMLESVLVHLGVVLIRHSCPEIATSGSLFIN